MCTALAGMLVSHTHAAAKHLWLSQSIPCCCLSGCGDCRRTLDSPDFQLLVHFDELCPCGSSTRRASCCYSTCEADQGGVLWPQFHCCGCDNAADTFVNPNVCCIICVGDASFVLTADRFLHSQC